MTKRTQGSYQFGPFHLNADERRLLYNGEDVPVAAKAFDLLLTLVQNNGRVLSKDELLNAVWPDVSIEENNLSVNISALRNALRRGGDDRHQYIDTVPKHGYRFNATVKNAQGNKGRGISSIAVLPLVNAGGTAKTEYLSDGITESLIYHLSQLPRLRVVERSTVFRYKGAEVDACEVGRALQVDAVLSGRVLRVARRLIIRVEIADVASGWHMWGEQYNQPAANILAVQREISQAVSEQLQLRLSVRQKRSLAKRQTENNEAYHAYLKGRYFLAKRTIEGIKKGLEFFRQAIEIDPTYALAYVGIADSFNLLHSYGSLSPQEAFPKVKEAARQALKIDANLAEAHASIGFVRMFERDWAGAEREFKRAVKIKDDYPTAHHWYAIYLKSMGRFEEAFRESRYALRLDPLSLVINLHMASLHYCARQYDQAIEQATETLKFDPNYYVAHGILGAAYAQKGMHRKAAGALQKAISLSSQSPEALALLGHAYAIAGKKGDARRVLRRLQELSKHRYVEPTCMALVYVGLNEKDAAFEWLEKAYEERDELMSVLAVQPLFDNLRTDSRFTDLLRRTGLDKVVLQRLV